MVIIYWYYFWWNFVKCLLTYSIIIFVVVFIVLIINIIFVTSIFTSNNIINMYVSFLNPFFLIIFSSVAGILHFIFSFQSQELFYYLRDHNEKRATTACLCYSWSYKFTYFSFWYSKSPFWNIYTFTLKTIFKDWRLKPVLVFFSANSAQSVVKWFILSSRNGGN